MPSKRQELGTWGESLVRKSIPCPKCKRSRTLRMLPPGFRCADIICDFCGYLAQVKTAQTQDVAVLPRILPGAAWKPQHDRMEAGIYFPLFIVLTTENRRHWSIYYLPADLQTPELFEMRAPLSANAKRAGWQGFLIRLDRIGDRAPVRLASSQNRRTQLSNA